MSSRSPSLPPPSGPAPGRWPSSSLPSSPRRRVFVAFFLACLALLAAACAIIGSLYLDDRRGDIERAAGDRLALLAAGRATAVAAWHDGLARQPDEIVNSDVIRLFVTEAGKADGGAELPFYLLQQRGYVVSVLDDFVARNGLAHAWLVDAGGTVMAASAAAPDFTPAQATRAMRLASASARAAAVLAAAGDGFTLDLHVAVGRPAGLEAAGPAPGILVMSLDPAPDLARFLEPSPLFGRAERYVLVQDEPGPLALARAPDGAGLRQAAEPAGGGNAYAAAAAVDGTAWRMVAAMDRTTVLAPLDAARDTVLTVSAAAFVVLFLVMLAAWLNQTRQFNEALAADYARSARRIDDQRRLLARINEAIADGIGLAGPDGAYVQVNPAFARILARPAAEIEGRTDEALFGRAVAERLADARTTLARRDETVAVPARLAAGGAERDVDILPVPLRDADGRPERWLTVIHDRTGERAARRRRDQAAAQMTVAFMKAIELADDWLHGQGAFVSEVALMLADRLGAAERERETIRIAAGLYQIGKLFIPRDILLKQGPLTPTETETMHGHVARLVRLVDGMDFGYPVQTALATLHERLDGSGYPKGLAGEAIGPAARVLGVADAFCALARPRPWRAAMAPEAAVAVIEDDAVRYDATVVAALRAAVGDGTVTAIMARQFG